MVGGNFGKLATVMSHLSHGFQVLAGYRRPGALISGALFMMATMVALLAWTPEANAYAQYTPAKGGTDGCAACHGDFNGNAGYISLQDLDPFAWATETMTAHSNDMLQGTCAACHGSGAKYPVLMSSSNDATLNLSCQGCHGRTQDAGTDLSGIAVDPDPGDGNPWLTTSGSGAGLRQAHFNANRIVPRADGGAPDQSTQICATCHADANPAYYTPVDEDVIPPYYQLAPLDVVPPTDPCNVPAGTEAIYGTLGLDNDGDTIIDGDEVACAANTPPVANAGGPYTATLGNPVNLDGSGTTDTTPTGTLEFTWSLLAKPAGSALTLGTASITQDLSANASFTPDAHGDYTIELSVTDGLDIGTNQVVISTTNNPPVAAFVGEPYSGTLGSTVTLDGTASDPIDPGDTITYEWSLPTRPAGSTATLTSLVNPTTSFTIDVYGTYQAQLVVRDQLGLASAPATTTITTSNTVPVAGFAASYSGAPGIPINIQGTVNDPDVSAGVQTATWTFNMNAVPAGSALPLGPTSITQDGTAFASFTPDVEGSYTVQVEVSDGTATSAPVTTAINTLNTPPTVFAGNDQAVAVSALVQLAGTANDNDGHTLIIAWTQVSGPAATLSDSTILNPTFTAATVGTYIWQLAADDGYVVVTDQMQVVVGSNNTPPTASAGGPYSGFRGDTVTLTGVASDADVGDTLTYSWALLSKPTGSTTVIVPVGPTSTEASLTIDVTGNYLVEFTATDNGSPPLGTSATTTVTTNNTQPVANAGLPQTVNVNQLVTLSGSVTDPDDFDSHTYAWSFAVLPTLSNLINADIAQSGLPDQNTATFTPDVKGDYQVQLIVTDDGTPPSSSAPATVTITTNNSAPIAVAGGDQLSVPLGGTVNLDGTGSSDPDLADTISYSWSFISKPVGSTATIVPDATPGLASFVADLKGDYNVQLTVTDDDVTPKSTTDAMLARVLNSVPVANAGLDQNIVDGGLVTLDGSGSSDPDPGETATLSYSWTLTAKPAGSTAALSAANIVNPTFTADAPGTYTANLTVSDGFSVSAPDQVNIVNTSTVATPQIVLSPATYDFGSVLVGTNKTANVAIQNLGSGLLTVSGLSLSGADFAYSGPGLPFSISSGYQVSLQVTYTPGAAGASVPGSLTVTSDDPDTPSASFTLNGTGYTGSPVINLPATSVVYGDVEVAATQAAYVIIKNQGTANLNVTGLSVTGSADFALPGGAPTSYVIQPGRQVTVQVNYTPGEVGPDTGSLVITSDDAVNPSLSVSLDGNGVAASGTPVISTPPSIAFGDLTVGSWKREFVSIHNAGTGDLQVNSLALTGSADFTFFNAPTTPFIVKPGRQVSFKVEYLASAGPASGSVDIGSDDPVTPSVSVLLSGNGIGGTQGINLPSTSVAYGDVLIGTSQRAFVAIQNLGTGDLLVNSLTLTGSGDFTLFNAPAGAFTIKPGRQATIKVDYAPTVAGAAAGSIAINSDDPVNPNLSVSLGGNGVGGTQVINLPTTSIVYGDVSLGTTKSTSLAIQNTGTGDLQVTGLSFTGSTDFALATGTPTSYLIAPGRQVTVTVNYGPTVTGAATGSLVIASDDPVNPSLSVNLDGNGVTPVGTPDINVPTASIAYGDVLVGQVKTATVAIQNLGTVDLNVTGLTLTGSGDFGLAAGTPASFVVGAGRQVTVKVNYSPSVAGAASGSLAIASDDPVTPNLSVSLSGNGLAGVGDINIPVASYDYGDVVVGTSGSAYFAIQNLGTGDLQVTGLTVTGSGDFTLAAGTPTSFVVAAGRQVIIWVNYTPSATGPVAGTLSVTSDDIDEPSVSVPLAGNGAPAV